MEKNKKSKEVAVRKNEAYLFVDEAWETTTKMGVNLKCSNKVFSISKKDAEALGVKVHDDFIGKCIVLDTTKPIKKIGSGEYSALTITNIKKITSDLKELEEIKALIETEIKIKNDKCFSQSTDKHVDGGWTYNFKNVFSEISNFVVDDSLKRIMSSAEKVIEESDVINQELIFVTHIDNDNTFDLNFFSKITNGEIYKFVSDLESEFSEIIISKKVNVLIPTKLKNQNKKIIDYLKTTFLVSSDRLNANYKLFEDGKIELYELVNNVNFECEKKMMSLVDLTKNSPSKNLMLDWPFMVGKTNGVEKSTTIFAPIFQQCIQVTETIDSIKLRKTNNQLRINKYPIVQNHIDSKRSNFSKLLKHYENTESIIKELAINNIRLSDDVHEEVTSLSLMTEIDINDLDLVNGSFKIINQAIFKVYEEKNELNKELNEIFKLHNDFPVPYESYKISSKNTLKDRNYIFDVDDSKSFSINQAIDNPVVIIGPPGTGKTETITSVIAEILKNKKSGIIVAEMKTALEAIKTKLIKAGIEDYTLHIDNEVNMTFILKNKINKIKNLVSGEVLDELDFHPINFENNWVNENKAIIDFYEKIKTRNVDFNELNNYVNAYKKSGFAENKFLNIFRIASMGGAKNVNETLLNELNSKIIEQRNLLGEIDVELALLTKKFMNDLQNNFNIIISPNEIAFALSKNKPETLKLMIESKMIKKAFALSKISRKEALSKLTSNFFVDFTFGRDKKFLIENNVLTIEHDIKKMKEESIEFDEKDVQMCIGIINDNKLNEDWLIKNADLFKELNEMICLEIDVNKMWESHKNKIHENILVNRNEVHKIYKNNLIKNYESDKNFRNDLIRLIKFVEGNLSISESNSKLYNLIKCNEKIIKTLFPIIMCNPDLISQNFSLDQGLFDYSIFDEASQIRLHRSLPALYRSKSIIVSGDDKQLGPSDVFTDVRSECDFDFSDVADNKFSFKTLLDFARSNYENVFLKTHYRSRGKDLISFSNNEFYGSSINVVDAPDFRFDGRSPIIVENVNGYFEQGEDSENGVIGSRNIIEARRVVEIFYEYYVLKNKTVGIVTFSDAQQILIHKLINARFKSENLMNLLDNTKYFIKNINSVQGDEMDVVIFSVVYGKWKDRNFVVKNFTRISKEKINVAITRAKFRLHVIKSINSSDIDAKRASTNEDVAVFQRWLRHIESYEDINTVEHIGGEITDNFQSVVFETIENALPDSYEIHKNLVVGEKTLPIAIFNTDKNIYVGGIEFDGYGDLTDVVKRQKDYSNRKLLESQGWNIYIVQFWIFFSDTNLFLNNIFKKFGIS